MYVRDCDLNPNMKDIFSRFTHTRVIALLVALLVIAIGAGVYFYQKATQVSQEQASAMQLEQTVARVGRLMVLPDGETPTLATVSDPEKLKGQLFFARAQKGDIVLIYSTAKKAILYNPSLDKIVEIAPINAGDASGSTNVPLQKN